MTVPCYVDFDGVMNSITGDLQRAAAKTGFDGWVSADSQVEMMGRPFRLTTSDERNATAAGWIDAGLVNWFWLTTWVECPADVVDRTGIDRPFVAPVPPDDETVYWWKARVLRARHEPADRFVWIDDDAVPRGFRKEYPNALVVTPSNIWGLTRKETDYIGAWLRGET